MTRLIPTLLAVALFMTAPYTLAEVNQRRDGAIEKLPAPDVKLHLAGESRGNWLQIMAELGPGVTRAIRVHSEPSGTLLAVYVNDDLPEPVNNAFLERVTANANPGGSRYGVMSMPFRPGTRAVIHTTPPPTADQRLKVYITGSFPDEDGVVREQEISFTVTTNLANFAFTYTRHLRPEASGLGRHLRRLVAQGNVCCGQTTDCGGRSCTDCTTSDYCCSKETSTTCGWCGKNLAECGSACTPC